MAWTGQRRRGGGSLRLTGFFKSKTKRGLAVGGIKPDSENAEAFLKLARMLKEGKSITLFLWRNDPDDPKFKGTAVFNLTGTEGREDSGERSGIRRDSREDREPAARARRAAPAAEVDDDDDKTERDDDIDL